MSMKSQREMVLCITQPVDSVYPRAEGVITMQRNIEYEQKYISSMADLAGVFYEAWSVKLLGKVGEITQANLEISSSICGYSRLTVKKPDGSIQQWKIQMIINCSVNGKVFHQWPTRLVK